MLCRVLPDEELKRFLNEGCVEVRKFGQVYKINVFRRKVYTKKNKFCTDFGTPVYNRPPDEDFVAAMYLAIKHRYPYWRRHAVASPNYGYH